ncbi:MAG: PilZ domain-containing protein [Nitrospiraceae bacterium]
MYRRYLMDCSFHYLDDRFLGSGTVRDLSKKGWRVEGGCRVQPGMKLSLSVLLPGLTVPLKVEKSTVRWTRGQEFGLQILEMQVAEWGRFERFISGLTELT